MKVEAEGLQVVGGHVDITPGRPTPLAGFATRRGAHARVADPLEANAVVIRDAAQQVLLLSLDLLYVGELRERIAAGLSDLLRPEGLWCAASHTHFAPATDPELPGLGAVDPDYLELATTRIVELCRRLLSTSGERVRASYREGLLAGGVNRRREGLRLDPTTLRIQRRIEMRPNPGGARDATCRVIGLHATDRPHGQLRALLWGWACHPVAFPVRHAVSAEYPGVARNELRRRFGADLPVLFFQGLAGNQRPDLRREVVSLRARLGRFVDGPAFAKVSLPEWHAWAADVGAGVARLAGQPGRPCAGPLFASRVEQSRPDLPAGICAARISLGSELHLVGLSAEPVAEHLPLFTAGRSGHVVPVGYLDRTQHYVVTPSMRKEGGYESGAYASAFGLRHAAPVDADATLRSLLSSL